MFGRRTKIESGLTKQKEEISNIIKEYDAFIIKLIDDKKQLSENCQKYSNSYDKTLNNFNNFKEVSERRLHNLEDEEYENNPLEKSLFIFIK